MNGWFALPTARRLSLALVLTSSIVGVSLPAEAEVGTVQNLSPTGTNAYAPQVAVDEDGDAVAVWQRLDGTDLRVQARRRTAAGDLSTIQTLSVAGQHATSPQVAVDPSGDALVVWRRSDGTNLRIQARARSVAGNLSTVQGLSSSGEDASDPQVGLDQDGNAVAVWKRFDGSNWRIQVRARAAGGGLESVQTLSTAGEDASGPQVAVDQDGDALAVWSRSDGQTWRIQARARSAAGTLSAVQTLSAAGEDATDPQVAVDQDGDALVVWQRSDGTNVRIQAVKRSAAGALGGVQTISLQFQDAYSPDVAAGQNGSFLAGWQRYNGASSRIQVKRRSPTGTWTTVQTLSDGPNDVAARVAMDQDGDAVVVWQAIQEGLIEGRRRSAGGTLGAVLTLSDPGHDATQPQVAIDPAGDAIAVWRRSNGTYYRIQGVTL